jgi:hypothetical protein
MAQDEDDDGRFSRASVVNCGIEAFNMKKMEIKQRCGLRLRLA